MSNEIGKKYRIVHSQAGNDDMVVSVLGYAGENQLAPVGDKDDVITWEDMAGIWYPYPVELGVTYE